MFTSSAPFYDALYCAKDYAGEVRRLRQLIATRVAHARTLLDVGCATGSHLVHWAEDFVVEGVDLDERLLEQARRKLPKAAFTSCDVCELDLGRRFDVVTCLYGSIAYVRTLDRLGTALRRLAAHLVDGGCLVVEPWYRTVDACPRSQVRHVDQPGIQIARLSQTRLAGRKADIEVHYLVSDGQGIRHLREEHRVAVFSDAEHVEAFRSAGLSVELVREALGTDSDALVGQRA